jgi:hypothetical protein
LALSPTAIQQELLVNIKVNKFPFACDGVNDVVSFAMASNRKRQVMPWLQ